MTSLSIAALSLLTSMVTVLGILGIGQWWGSNLGLTERVARSLLALVILTGVLSLRIWWNAEWLAWGVWAAILAGAVNASRVFASYLRTIWCDKTSGLTESTSKQFYEVKFMSRLFIFIPLIILAIDALWGGLPLYRYDEWAYSLIISKWVDLLGSLKPPMTNDQVFFTGSFEFLGLLPRALSSNDAFQQGFQNSFGVLMVVVPSVLICFDALNSGSSRATQAQKSAVALAFGTLVLFGTGDHQGLVNAKPDFVIMMFAACIMMNMVKHGQKSKISPLIIGALMVAGLAYKITWIHFAITASPVILWQYRPQFKNHRWDFRSWIMLTTGAFLALPLAAPLLVKNWQIFGNPLHPGQTSIWPSHVWNQELTDYWRGISEKPEGLLQFIVNLGTIFKSFARRFDVTMPVLAGLLAIFFSRKNETKPSPVSATKIATVFFIYVILWGTFYGGNIADRFVSPIHAMVLVALIALLSSIRIHGGIVILLLIPFLLTGKFEVTLMNLGSAATRTVDEYHDYFSKSPSAKLKVIREVSAHRDQAYPNAAFNEAAAMSDFYHVFYAPMKFYPAHAPISLWALNSIGIEPSTGCAAEFFRMRNIRYVVWLDESDLNLWPAAVLKLLPKMTQIDVSMGKAWYVEDWDRLNCNL